MVGSKKTRTHPTLKFSRCGQNPNPPNVNADATTIRIHQIVRFNRRERDALPYGNCLLIRNDNFRGANPPYVNAGFRAAFPKVTITDGMFLTRAACYYNCVRLHNSKVETGSAGTSER